MAWGAPGVHGAILHLKGRRGSDPIRWSKLPPAMTRAHRPRHRMATLLALLAAIAALAVVWRGRPPERPRLDRFKSAAKGPRRAHPPRHASASPTSSARPMPTPRSASPTRTPRTTSPPSRARSSRRADGSRRSRAQAGAANDYMVGLLRVTETVESEVRDRPLARGSQGLRSLRRGPEPLRVAPSRGSLALRLSRCAARTWSRASSTSCRSSSASTARSATSSVPRDERRCRSRARRPPRPRRTPSESPYGSNAFAVGPVALGRRLHPSRRELPSALGRARRLVRGERQERRGLGHAGRALPGHPGDPARRRSAPRLGPHREQARPRRRLRARRQSAEREPVPLRRASGATSRSGTSPST